MAASRPPLATLFVHILLLLLVSAHSISAVAQKHHFVLIHGAWNGGWCWYRVITMLEAAGNSVTAIDLTSGGRSKVVPDTVTSVAQYTKPLTDFLANNVTAEKIILVGHSMGGSSISYAMELFPNKISKAVFVAALMPYNGQQFASGPPGFQQNFASLVQNGTFILNYANGPSSPPTSLMLNLTQAKAYVYSKSPTEDVNLAYTLLSPQPQAPTTQILNLTSTNYGSVKRFYIKTSLSTGALPLSTQEAIIQLNPPKEVFKVNHSDHSPFFSQPRALVRILLSISSSN